MIDVKHVTKKYGSFTAVDDVSLTVETASIVGLLGPNGAGKTSLMRVLTGYHLPNGGDAYIDGIDVVTNDVAAKELIGYLPESLPLYPDLSVIEYLSFIASARRLEAINERMEYTLERCGLTSMAHRKIDDLSKGYKQRVGLAQATLHNPSVLILDEPTSGLDPRQILDIRDYIRELGETKTVILSTHIMQEVEALCKEVLIMNQGKIVATGSVNELQHNSGELFRFSIEFSGKLNKKSMQRLSSLEHILGVSDANSSEGRQALELRASHDISEQIFDFACAEGIKLLRLIPHKTSLEDVFVKLTGGAE